MKLGTVKQVQVGLVVELGRTVRNLDELSQLGAGSLVELDSICGEPVNLLAGGVVIARGEVVVMGENFGLRVTQLVEEEP